MFPEMRACQSQQTGTRQSRQNPSVRHAHEPWSGEITSYRLRTRDKAVSIVILASKGGAREIEMDEKIVQQILDQLFPSLEALDTQSGALLQFVKDKKLASDEEITSYFEQAGNASSVRWRAARARINYLVSTAANATESVPEKKSVKATDPGPAPTDGASAKPNPEKDESDVSGGEKAVPSAPTSRSAPTEDKGDKGKGAA
jgi:hypothetical protein